jgi:hypothetical protein
MHKRLKNKTYFHSWPTGGAILTLVLKFQPDLQPFSILVTLTIFTYYFDNDIQFILTLMVYVIRTQDVWIHQHTEQVISSGNKVVFYSEGTLFDV